MNRWVVEAPKVRRVVDNWKVHQVLVVRWPNHEKAGSLQPRQSRSRAGQSLNGGTDLFPLHPQPLRTRVHCTGFAVLILNRACLPSELESLSPHAKCVHGSWIDAGEAPSSFLTPTYCPQSHMLLQSLSRDVEWWFVEAGATLTQGVSSMPSKLVWDCSLTWMRTSSCFFCCSWSDWMCWMTKLRLGWYTVEREARYGQTTCSRNLQWGWWLSRARWGRKRTRPEILDEC